MKAHHLLAAAICTAGTALAASNDELQPKTADTPLVAYPLDGSEAMAEDLTRDPLFPLFSPREGMSVQWGGRIMWDTTLLNADAVHPSGSVDGSEFRRARLFAAIDISEHVAAKAEYGFEGGNVSFQDVYLTFKSVYGDIVVGHHYQPISFEDLTSSRYITFLERALPVLAFAPSRDAGISTSNKFNDNTRWALGVFRPSGGAGPGSGNGTGDGQYSVTGRLVHSIESGDSTIHLGLSSSFSGSRDATRISARPEVHQANRVLDSKAGTSDSNLLVGLEAAWTSGPSTVQAEYLMNSVERFNIGTGAEDVTFFGYYISYSHMLTGESRPYIKSGKWGRIKPNQNWEGNDLDGAWEAALRYSTLDLTDGSFDQEATGLTLGLNWYLNSRTKILFNVVRSEADISGVDSDLTALLARFQVDW